MKLSTLALSFAAVVLCQCTSVSIEQQGPDQYLASGRNGAGMFVNYPALKAKVIARANEFAAKQGKTAVGSDDYERNRFIPGFPRYDYTFRLQ